KFRLPRDRAVTIVIVHIDRDVLSAFPEQAIWQRPAHQIECSHSDPVGPRVADNDDVAIVRPHLRVSAQKVVVRPGRLQPIVTARMKWNAEFDEALSKGNNILLKISRVVAAVEIDAR